MRPAPTDGDFDGLPISRFEFPRIHSRAIQDEKGRGGVEKPKFEAWRL
ncbi:MAG: hypothetical protein PHH11_00625 [Methylomonas sp.]|nr:hypothetical protein [Methylomonas sp.]